MNEVLLQDLHSKIHVEHRCLTTKAVAIEHSLSRRTAISLLERLPYFDTGKEFTYEVTRCKMSKRDGKYVANLQTNLETVRQGDQKPDKVSQIYSISLKTPSNEASILATHEETISLLKDHQDTMLIPDLSCDAIYPANTVQKIDRDDARSMRIKGGLSVAMKKSVPSKKTSAPPKRDTTAASFFKKVKGKSETNANKKTSFRKKVASKEENLKKGNADDFVGDVDEDDDFLREEEERKKRNATHAEKENLKRKRKEKQTESMLRRIPMREEDENEIEEEENDKQENKSGAMDAFASKKIKVAHGSSRQKGKTRKKQVLEERTFTDERGFLRTEMISTWKDVEEPEATSSPLAQKNRRDFIKPKPKSKSSKNMKQQGLMGFFSKKK